MGQKRFCLKKLLVQKIVGKKKVKLGLLAEVMGGECLSGGQWLNHVILYFFIALE